VIAADASAQAALLLSHWWSRPTDDERQLWSESFGIAEDVAAELGGEPELVRELADALELTDGEAMLDEYERLFVGPGAPPCQPYESLWVGGPRRRDGGSVMGPAAIAVSSVYKELGLTFDEEMHELPDHLVIEWEALAYALSRGAAEVSDTLLRGHLGQWMAPFCEAVSETSTEPFYARLAGLTSAWMAALAG
jgi:putative dimethyl sulfoxide reductase chaperone